MSAVVIDTNVLLVADGQATHMSGACQIQCLSVYNAAGQMKKGFSMTVGGLWGNTVTNLIRTESRRPVRFSLSGYYKTIRVLIGSESLQQMRRKPCFRSFRTTKLWRQRSTRLIANSSRPQMPMLRSHLF